MVKFPKKDKSPIPKNMAGCTSEAKAKFNLAEYYTVQARRLEHIAARLKILARSDAAYGHGLKLIAHNNRTMAVIKAAQAVHDEKAMELVREAQDKLQEKGVAAYAAIRRAAAWHDSQAGTYKEQAMTLANGENLKNFEDPKLGLKNLSRKLNGKPAQPLLHLSRDKAGPLGQGK